MNEIQTLIVLETGNNRYTNRHEILSNGIKETRTQISTGIFYAILAWETDTEIAYHELAAPNAGPWIRNKQAA